MSVKSYFDKELVATLVFAVIGILLGYFSFLLNNPPGSLVLMILIAAVVIFLFRQVVKIKEGFKWWLGNGLIAYIILWLVVWTIFYNVGLR
ncbi:MAG: hypothetical protein NT120_01270 [Candidatus Aenigmarchaeota archaeon]|nr:hypothetical protein [Candidatus Aenigmarchaeota archaeon]